MRGMALWILLVAVFCAEAALSAPLDFDIVTHGQEASAQKLYPNTVGKDQAGDMPWIVRRGTNLPAAYHLKDNNQGNALWLEELTLYARNDSGHWFVHTTTGNLGSCNVLINSDLWVAHTSVDLSSSAFDGYDIGDRIDFRWFVRFRDNACLNLVQKNQYHQVIVGEPLPLFSSQHAANLHTHSFYTDNIGEWGGTRELLPSSARAVDLDAVLWTDHGYDFTFAECESMSVFAAAHSDAGLLVLPGSEGNVDDDAENQTPDDVLHTLTNVCLRTPSEIPGTDNFNTQLWTLERFQNEVEDEHGYWAAAHPFSAPFVQDDPGDVAQWSAEHVAQALADDRFVGFQIWNRPRASTIRSLGDDDLINPYPWTPDPTALDELEVGIRRLDEIQQQYLQPLRRVTALAGVDNHGDYSYTTAWHPSGQRVIYDSAFGKCFTVLETGSLNTTTFWQSMSDGQCYMSNGPACSYGVDQDGNGSLETRTGSLNLTSDAGIIRCYLRSNAEFGEFTKAIIYVVTESSRDSSMVALSGLNTQVSMPVANLDDVPAFVWIKAATEGGYGDYDGLVLTGRLYFNTTVAEVTDQTDSKSFLFPISPNPVGDRVEIAWAPEHRAFHIEIIDSSGRLIRSFVPDQRSSAIEWDRLTSIGQPALRGVYFIRVAFANRTFAMRKAVIVD